MMMPRWRACSAAKSYSASAVSRTCAASSAPTSLCDLLESDVLVVLAGGRLRGGREQAAAASCSACRSPGGSAMPQSAPVC